MSPRRPKPSIEERVAAGRRRSAAFIKATQGQGKPGAKSSYGSAKAKS